MYNKYRMWNYIKKRFTNYSQMEELEQKSTDYKKEYSDSILNLNAEIEKWKNKYFGILRDIKTVAKEREMIKEQHTPHFTQSCLNSAR